MNEKKINIVSKHGNIDASIFYPDTSKKLPCIIFFMDAPAIREELRVMARKIASNDYFVILPNLFYRKGTEGNYPFDQEGIYNSKAELEKMLLTMKETTNSMVCSDVGFIINYIKSNKIIDTNKLGLLGYCMSGQFIVTAGAMYSKHIKAIASFYGVGIYTKEADSPLNLISKIKAEIYLGYAEKDKYVSEKEIEVIKETLTKENINSTIEIYEKTDHGFAFPGRYSYNENAAKKHWKRIIDLFLRNLK